MKLLLIVVALLISQSVYAADSTKVKKSGRVVDTVKVEKAEKRIKSQKTKTKEKSAKGADTVKVAKSEKSEQIKASDTLKVVLPPAPLFTDIIPQPISLVKGEGRFRIDSYTAIICDKEFEKAADYLRLYIPTERTNGKKSNSIRLVFDKRLGKEAYSLCVNKKGIEISGSDYGGIFNGIQSLLQLLPHSMYTKNAPLPMEVAYVDIKDAPQYHYRGLLLDVARTFQPVHEVKRVLDYMAYYKFNKLHFHLADNQGWRVELKKYPQFAEVGGFRGGDSPIAPANGCFNQKYGGYYTQNELREIVAYAAERNIEIIPEIDMPGHSRALGVVHPAIRCNYTPKGVDNRNVWCVAKESNYALIEDIIKELVDIFPSEYIHIGGDEVNFSLWKRCPDCQKLMQDKGLKSGAQLEQHFLKRVSDILTKYNRRAVVWDEAVDGGLLPKTTMVSGWRGVKQCLNSTANGYTTIIMPTKAFYLDYHQSEVEPGRGSVLSLKTICDFNFENAGFSAEQHKYIAGVEGAFWSELYLGNINSKRHFSDYLEYMLFPRLLGIAEIGWSKERRSYDDMMKVLKENSYHKLHAMSATFRIDPPIVKVELGKIFASAEDGVKIYYKDIRNNKTQEYKSPLDAKMAPFVEFYCRWLTGRSVSVGAPEYYNFMTPTVKIISSMPFSEKYPVENCELYKGETRTTRAAKEGDWVEFRFEKPVKCQYLKVLTGLKHILGHVVGNGHIEVCYDGEKFVDAGALNNGKKELRPKNRPIHALRIVVDGDGTGAIRVQPLEIK
uniref:family 20 glycosylhydrolase n=1 Tax=Alistipes sp. TaxID=1872444 RepID=UPI004055C878